MVVTRLWPAGKGSSEALPLFLSRVPAGFPSPADDYAAQQLDLHEHLIPRPASTFFLRVEGMSMRGAGIHSGDLLIVDRSEEPKSGSVVVAALDGELTVKRLVFEESRVYLRPEHPSYEAIEITGAQDLVVWGVVRHVIHAVD